jgi:ATP-dependent DNA helicase RecG
MYTLDTSIQNVKGVGPKLAEIFAQREMTTVRDALLFIPLRYEDRSEKKSIAHLLPGELVTLEIEVVSSRNFYKGRRSIQSATVKDETGKLKLMWFNNPHVVTRLIAGKRFFVSGKLNDRGTMTQPVVEAFSNDAIHTGRFVPIYSQIPDFPAGTLRRLLKHILDELADVDDHLREFFPELPMSLQEALTQIHFPDSEDKIVDARERFALEELLALIQHSQNLKKSWQKVGKGVMIPSAGEPEEMMLPFVLTRAQLRCAREILSDLNNDIPMNRLLIGDVGSGKTAVAGIACNSVLAAGHHAVLIAPTQILAEQHITTFQKLFPQLAIQLVTAKTSKSLKSTTSTSTPTLFVGTHAIFSHLEKIAPALLIYDEQHRFGVTHRSLAAHLKRRPHILTLTATPIPRTLMLTIFSHLQLSVIDQLPPGRKPVQTWLVPKEKRHDAYEWIAKQTQAGHQALLVCPFIDPSQAAAFENIASATRTYQTVVDFFAKKPALDPTIPLPKIALLHGRTPKKEQAAITEQLYKKEIDILVTTPIVEVGIDLPAASIILIEAAERFGLASLHQLRGRVGRAGQQAYCLLFTSSQSAQNAPRLKKFCQIHEGLKLAEMDLEHRGAGDIFGTQQHGFDELRFANWTNLELITQAKKMSDWLGEHPHTWQSFFHLIDQQKQDTAHDSPLAN